VREWMIRMACLGAGLALALPAQADFGLTPGGGFEIGPARGARIAPGAGTAMRAPSAATLAHGAPHQRVEAGAASRLEAIGASLLLPGLGHRAVGRERRGRTFMVADAALLVGIAVGQAQGYVRKKGYIDYAEDFAGVGDIGGKPDWYYRNLGQYRSSDAYVHDVARTARAIHGDDLAARDDYVARNSPAADEAWTWRSDADRREFRERRKASRDAYRRASLFLGAALFNRLLSAVDAARLASRPRLAGALEWRMDESGAHYPCLAWSLR